MSLSETAVTVAWVGAKKRHPVGMHVDKDGLGFIWGQFPFPSLADCVSQSV